jgi:hypothetical protein
MNFSLRPKLRLARRKGIGSWLSIDLTLVPKSLGMESDGDMWSSILWKSFHRMLKSFRESWSRPKTLIALGYLSPVTFERLQYKQRIAA